MQPRATQRVKKDLKERRVQIYEMQDRPIASWNAVTSRRTTCGPRDFYGEIIFARNSYADNFATCIGLVNSSAVILERRMLMQFLLRYDEINEV